MTTTKSGPKTVSCDRTSRLANDSVDHVPAKRSLQPPSGARGLVLGGRIESTARGLAARSVYTLKGDQVMESISLVPVVVGAAFRIVAGSS